MKVEREWETLNSVAIILFTIDPKQKDTPPPNDRKHLNAYMYKKN